MRPAGFPDRLTVINGPEDGVEFPINRSPFNVGQDGQCAVCLQLDSAVTSVHAKLSASGDGYEVRSVNGGAVYVDGKKAGMIRSRALRPRGVLRVGCTELILECAPDGLFSRSKGIVARNDALWALRTGFKMLLASFRRAGHFVRMAFWRLLRRWKLAALIAAGVIYYYVPAFRQVVNRALGMAVGLAQQLFSQLAG